MREARRIKDEMAAKYGYDVRALGKAIQEAERRSERKHVTRRQKGAKIK